jgi:putative transposase
MKNTARKKKLREAGPTTQLTLADVIRRYQAHKARNVLDQLLEDMHHSVRQALRDAYGTTDANRAERLLASLVRRLRDAHPGAAGSLEEGLDETPTVKRLGLPSKLERQFSTTNATENVMVPFADSRAA